MKIVYLFGWRLGGTDGVIKKIEDQVRVWREQGHTVTIYCVSREFDGPSGFSIQGVEIITYIPGGPLTSYRRQANAYAKALGQVKGSDPDAVYFRLSNLPLTSARELARLPTVLEVNADPIGSLSSLPNSSRFPKWIWQLYTKTISKRLFSSAVGVLAVTHELAKAPLVRLCCDRKVIPNGIDLRRVDVLPYIKHNSQTKTFRVAFLAGGPPPIAVKKFHTIAKVFSDAVEFLVIGSIPPDEALDNVKYIPFCREEEYRSHLATCDAGLSRLGLPEVGLAEACNLKVREYLASGLPVIVAHHDTAFMESKPSWILESPTLEHEPASVYQEVLDFLTRISGYRVSHSESEPYIDCRVLEQRRLQFVNRFLHSSQP